MLVAVLNAPSLLPSADAGSGTPAFAVYAAPGSLTDSNNAGEPSIGVNWNTNAAGGGTVMYQAYASTYKVVFNDASTPATAAWTRVTPSGSAFNIDPILFTDSSLGRTWAGGLSGACSVLFYTDNDGSSWSPPINTCSGAVDHESVGAGPWHAPGAPLLSSYSHGVYYCAQNSVDACSTSKDGGTTYGSPATVGGACGGLHGHIKVSADGTAYLPNQNCGGKAGGGISTNNGGAWSSYTIGQSSTRGRGFDPSVATTPDNTVYEAWANSTNDHPYVARSTSHGASWDRVTDLAATVSPALVASTFQSAVAGDNGRVAVAFLGTSVGGGAATPFDNGYQGVWYLYVSYSYDAGLTWTTVKADPDPVQRGCIWDGGGSNACRNLLDFMDASVTKDGRVVVGYADGCLGCTTIAQSTNAYATIARQSTGKGLFAAYDGGAATAPGAPTLNTATAGNGQVSLAWSAPSNDGGAAITNYKLYRGTTSGGETLLTTLGNVLSYTDTGLTNGQAYYYEVAAQNSVGTGALSNEKTATPTAGNQAPTACFTHSESGLTTSVNGGCSTDDGSIASYDWNWGDASAHGTGATPSHAYATGGTYTVTLTVTDNLGATGTTSQSVTVSSGGDPDPSTPTLANGVASSGTSGASGSWQYYKIQVPSGKTQLQVVLSSSQSCGLLSCNPDLDLYVRQGAKPTTSAYGCSPQTSTSSETCTLASPAADWWYVGVYVYSGSSALVYTIKATYTPSSSNQAPTACFSHSETGLSTSVNGGCSSDPDGSVASYDWNWGDASAHGTGATASHSYAAGGTYTVTLTVTDNGGATGTTSQSVTVSSGSDPDPSTPNLSNGAATSDTTGASGTWKFYKIQVPSGKTQLQVVLDGPACGTLSCPADIDLYVKRAAKPTLSSYDCRPYEGDSDETCTLASPAADWWYVGAYVYSGSSGQAYTIQATYT